MIVLGDSPVFGAALTSAFADVRAELSGRSAKNPPIALEK